MTFSLNTRAQLLIIPEVCLNYDLKIVLHQNPRGYCSLQQIITVCGSCDCEEMCTFHHAQADTWAQIQILSDHTLSLVFSSLPLIIAAGKPFNLARVLCIPDATACL